MVVERSQLAQPAQGVAAVAHSPDDQLCRTSNLGHPKHSLGGCVRQRKDDILTGESLAMDSVEREDL